MYYLFKIYLYLYFKMQIIEETNQNKKLPAYNIDDYCKICGENYNNKIIKICCEYCPMECCRNCSETFILGQNYPHCMDNNCKKQWTRKFMTRKFTNEFINKKYKKHREQILFEQEQSLLPATQLIIERNQYRENEMIKIQQKCYEIGREIEDLRIKQINYLRYYDKLKNNIFTIGQNSINDFDRKMTNDETSDNETSDDETTDNETTDNEKSDHRKKLKNKKIFTRKCSNNECHGFLSSRWNCSLCNTWTCNKCLINIGNNYEKMQHICNNDDLETAKLIKSDCKSCPNCSVSIFKISGCDQMFCTNCHTPFSWKTGEIEIGRNIHNPHYFEYVKQNKQNLERNYLDIPCGVELNGDLIYRFHYMCAIYNGLSNKLSLNLLVEIGRNIIHLNAVIIQGLNTQIDNYGKSNQTERIRYMTKIINETQFKKNIQTNEKKNLKNKEYIELYIMVRDTSSDLIRKFYNILNKYYEQYLDLKCSDDDKIKFPVKIKKETLDEKRQYEMKYDEIVKLLKNELEMENLMPDQLFQELNNLRFYANECLMDISKTYNSVKKEFDEKYCLINCGKK